MRTEKSRHLIARASKDFELAKGYMQLRDFVTASLLYNKAVEKVLKALYINRSKKEPPANASIDYLAQRTGVPDEISVYISSIKETDIAGPAELQDINGNEDENIGVSAERQAFYLDGLTKRLLDYVNARANI
jgi:HEPN domain-containing protein